MNLESYLLYKEDNPLYLKYLKNGRLPKKYQKVEYIESRGTQYIDTGFKPNYNTKVDIDFKTKSLELENNASIFGSRENALNKHYGCTKGGYNQFYTGYFNESINTYISLNENTRYHIIKDKNKTYLDGALVDTRTYASFQTDYNMYIFAMNQANGDWFRSNIKVYSCKIYDNDVLVRDFVPCYRKSDNEVGLYDLITKQFYTNQGTGQFTPGSDV